MVINDLLPARDLSSRNFFKPSLNLFIFPVSSTSLAFHLQPPAQGAAGRLCHVAGEGLGLNGLSQSLSWGPSQPMEFSTTQLHFLPQPHLCAQVCVQNLRRKERKV